MAIHRYHYIQKVNVPASLDTLRTRKNMQTNSSNTVGETIGGNLVWRTRRKKQRNGDQHKERSN